MGVLEQTAASTVSPLHNEGNLYEQRLPGFEALSEARSLLLMLVWQLGSQPRPSKAGPLSAT
jgi:hypothetical protein